MGVDVSHRVVYGVVVDVDGDLIEEMDDEGISYICRECPDELVLGVSLFDSGSHRRDWDGDSFVKLSLDSLEPKKQKYIKKFKKHIPKHAHLLDRPWSLLSFVNYT